MVTSHAAVLDPDRVVVAPLNAPLGIKLGGNPAFMIAKQSVMHA